jgi:hypothetical protein
VTSNGMAGTTPDGALIEPAQLRGWQILDPARSHV